MLKVEKLMVLLSATLIFTTCNTTTLLQPLAMNIEEEVNLKELKDNRLIPIGVIERQQHYKNLEIEYNRIMDEKREQERLEEEKRRKEDYIVNNTHEFILTFYTDLPEENGVGGAITCQGKSLTSGMVANNVIPLGTKIYTQEFGTLTVSDRGGNNFNSFNRLDVFLARQNGEDNYQYKQRALKLGRINIKGVVQYEKN